AVPGERRRLQCRTPDRGRSRSCWPAAPAETPASWPTPDPDAIGLPAYRDKQRTWLRRAGSDDRVGRSSSYNLRAKSFGNPVASQKLVRRSEVSEELRRP